MRRREGETWSEAVAEIPVMLSSSDKNGTGTWVEVTAGTEVMFKPGSCTET